ncbi:cell division septation protein DedD [Catenuloplanes indicus]|uniref:Cell division septation protein DedD n=1 Tax=Catenuloplanes indicus TaxID=137267 RepID=A0AAE4B278_9ACTN|nr:cell division septation protein DedD [Catenuloplanes indicus]
MTATLDRGCPGCGRAPNPVAAEVIALDGRIAVLTPLVETARRDLETARRVYDERATGLRAMQQRRTGLLAQIHAARVTVPAAPVHAAAPAPAPAEPPAARPETTTRTVQNVLFILGGLLLGTAAIVFTTIAWATFGLAGRAAILGGVTALALAAPLVALRRNLRATAETFAALGMLLILLDGYAAWYVNLLGVTALDPARYAGVVALLAAVIAAGYGWATGLTGPRLAALLLIQPVPSMLLGRSGTYATALVLAGTAAIDLVAARFPLPVRAGARSTDPGVRHGLRGLAWLLFGGWLFAAFAASLLALIADERVPGYVSPTALLVTGLLLVAASIVAGRARFRAVASGVFVVLVAIAAVRPVAEYGDRFWLVTATAVLVAIALTVWVVLPRLPEAVRPGPRAGALAVLCGTYAALAAAAAIGLLATIAQAGERDRLDAILDWQFPLALATLPLAIAPLLPAYTPKMFIPATAGASTPMAEPVAPRHWGGGWRGWHDPVIVAVTLGILSLPLGFGMPVAMAAGLALAAGAALLLTAARADLARSVLVRALAGTASVVSALALAAWWPGTFAVLLPLTVVLGVAVSLRAHGRNSLLGRPALGAALTGVPFAALAVLDGTVPGAAWNGATAARLSLAAAATVLLAVAAVRRWRPAYLGPAGVAFGLVMLFAGLPLDPGRDPRLGYAAGALLLTALAAYSRPLLAFAPHSTPPHPGPVPAVSPAAAAAPRSPASPLPTATDAAPSPTASGVSPWAAPGVPPTPWPLAAWGQTLLALAGLPLFIAVLLGVVDAISTVVLAPYTWLDRGWSEVPTGTGLSPGTVVLPVWSEFAAVALLTPVVWLAVQVADRSRRRWATLAAAAAAALATLVGLAAAGAPWPVIPAVSVTFGLTALLVAGWVRRTAALLVPAGLVLKGAALAGASPRPATTLAALGLSLIAGVVIGATGRGLRARLSGWLGAVLAAVALAGTTGAAADLPLRTTSLIILGVAVATLTLGALLRRTRPAEAGPVEVAAHATAVVAFLLVIGVDLRYAAAVALLWSIAVGIRAIFGPWRWPLGLTAAGWLLLAWWLLLGAVRIGVWEAYTLPAALVAAVVGVLAARRWPALTSWRAYAVSVTAALLPSLAAVLLGDASWQRRLLLGAGAVVLVVAGAVRRRQSPVVLGGGTLLLLSVTEVARVWDLLPRWLPFAVGGIVLVTLAITYERRRRDLARLRAAVGRMT